MKVGFVRKYKVKVGDKLLLACETLGIQGHLMHEFIHDNNCCIKVLLKCVMLGKQENHSCLKFHL